MHLLDETATSATLKILFQSCFSIVVTFAMSLGTETSSEKEGCVHWYHASLQWSWAPLIFKQPKREPTSLVCFHSELDVTNKMSPESQCCTGNYIYVMCVCSPKHGQLELVAT